MLAKEYVNNLFEVLSMVEIRDIEGRRYDLDDASGLMVDFIKGHAQDGGKVMFIGNGGSAAIASHCGIDFWKNGGIKSMCFNDGPSLTCIGNDFGYEYVFEKPIKLFAERGDILVAISSSGKSPNILLAVEAAREKGCRVITLSGFSENNPLRSKGHFNIYVGSQSYGVVELSHQIVLHMVLDLIMGKER